MVTQKSLTKSIKSKTTTWSNLEVRIMAYHFNNRIEILDIIESDGPEAGMSYEKVVAKPWADIKTLKGSEYIQSDLEVNEEPIRFIIRYRKGITTQQTVRYDGKRYNIKSVANDNGRNHTLTLFATTSE